MRILAFLTKARAKDTRNLCKRKYSILVIQIFAKAMEESNLANRQISSFIFDYGVKTEPAHSRVSATRACRFFFFFLCDHGVTIYRLDEIWSFQGIPESSIVVKIEWVKVWTEGTRNYKYIG